MIKEKLTTMITNGMITMITEAVTQELETTDDVVTVVLAAEIMRMKNLIKSGCIYFCYRFVFIVPNM